MSKLTLGDFKSKSDAAISFLNEQLKKIRSGRANSSLVEDIQVEAYGSMQPVKNLANISVVDASLLTVQPWDKSVTNSIVTAIQEANLGINPSPSGDLIRLPIPALTEERRHEYVKMMKDKVEEAKIAIRQIRKEVMSSLEEDKKDGNITEDDLKRYEKDLQKQVDDSNLKIDELAKQKEAELMTV